MISVAPLAGRIPRLALGAQRSPIGLDLGARRIKAAQLSRRAGALRLDASLSISRLDPGPILSVEDARRLGAALYRHGFKGRAACAAMPADLLFDAAVDLPPKSSKAPLAQIAAHELARVGRTSAESLVCAYWPTAASSSADATPTRIVGADRGRIDELLNSLDLVDAGAGALTPLALDTAPWALARCAAPWLGDPDDVTVIADLGWRRCALTIIYGRRIVYERTAPGMGAEALEDAIARHLGAPSESIERLLQRLAEGAAPEAAGEIASAAIGRQAELLATEVERSLRFAAEFGATGGYRLILVGGGASEPMAALTGQFLDGLAEVRRGTPGQLLAGAAGEAADDPGLICAIGLAMRMDR